MRDPQGWLETTAFSPEPDEDQREGPEARRAQQQAQERGLRPRGSKSQAPTGGPKRLTPVFLTAVAVFPALALLVRGLLAG